jgi:phage tail sheath protein FI
MLAAKSKSSRRGRAVREDNGAPGPLVRVVVRQGGTVVERSQLVDTAEAAAGWADTFSAFVSITTDDPAAKLEAVAPVDLSGGTNDANITPEIVGDTFDRFGDRGPGQMAYPGSTDPAVHAAILERCFKWRRVALLDLDDTDDPTLAADVMGLWRYDGARWAAGFAPRLRYVGPAPSTTILLPFSAAQMGVIARRDRATGNPNDPAAGDVAYIRGARGLAREFDDDTREQLNELGVTLARVSGRPATTFTYGSRTVAGPDEPNWKWFGGSRVVMAITHESNAGAEQFVHRQIDPQRRIFIALNSVLTAICERYFALGALYGETAEEAYRVVTDESVNTEDTIAAGEIHGLIMLATSPPGEWVLIEIAKQTTSLAAAA